MTEHSKYSLWLTPINEEAQQLQSLVDTLSADYDAPNFVPHITLVANLFTENDAELETIHANAKALAQKLGSFSITLSQFGYTEEEFRCLYLLADESAELDAAYKTAAEFFPQVQDEHFAGMPHMSVLYGHFPAKTKKGIIAEHQLKTPITMEVSSADLFLTNNPIESWKQAQSFPFRQQ